MNTLPTELKSGEICSALRQFQGRLLKGGSVLQDVGISPLPHSRLISVVIFMGGTNET